MNQAQREQRVIGLIHEIQQRMETGDNDSRMIAHGMDEVLKALELTQIQSGEHYDGEGICPEQGYHVHSDLRIYSSDMNIMRLLIRGCQEESKQDTREGNALKRAIMSAHVAYVFMGDNGTPGIQFMLGDDPGSAFSVWYPNGGRL